MSVEHGTVYYVAAALGGTGLSGLLARNANIRSRYDAVVMLLCSAALVIWP